MSILPPPGPSITFLYVWKQWSQSTVHQYHKPISLPSLKWIFLRNLSHQEKLLTQPWTFSISCFYALGFLLLLCLKLPCSMVLWWFIQGMLSLRLTSASCWQALKDQCQRRISFYICWEECSRQSQGELSRWLRENTRIHMLLFGDGIALASSCLMCVSSCVDNLFIQEDLGLSRVDSTCVPSAQN